MKSPDRIAPSVAARIGAERGHGGALAGPLRDRLEQRLGPLPDVRLHTDPAAWALAADLDAVAFTSGRDVFFSAGAFRPETTAGRGLLSHEVAHVLQQRDTTAPLVLDRDGSAQEHEARAGGPPRTAARAGSVQRAAASREREWAIENPEGQVTWDGRDHLILWNFDIGRSDLKPPHREALAQIADTFKLAMIGDPDAVLEVQGHASRSGGGELNEAIALERGGVAAGELVTERHVPPERIRLEGFGFQRPWVPNVSGAVMSRNRRVELRVQRFRKPQPPAPRPELRPPPEPEAPVKEPVFRWDENAPTIAFEIEIEIPAGSYVIGDFRVYPSGKFKFKFKVPTHHKDEVKLSLTKDGIKASATKKVGEWGEVKVQESGGKFQLAFGFPAAFGRPEVGVESDPLKPIVLKLRTPPTSLGRRDDIIPGLVVEAWGEFEGQFKIGPSERLAARLAARFASGAGAETAAGGAAAGIGAGGVAVAGGVILINVAWLAWGIYQLNEAHRRGRAWGATVNRRRGFAWRIAGEVVPEHFGSAFKEINDQYGRPAYRELYEGWIAAQEAINRTPSTSPALERLRKRHAGRWVLYVMQDIQLRLGGVRDVDDAPPLPTTLDELP